jgi:hypothetical protein
MERGDAKPHWKQGIFCIILQREPSGREMQDVAIGIDPGSKRTGVTVSTETRVVVNILMDAPEHVKDRTEQRRNMRRGRRNRNTPYRKCRYNRKIGGIPPSTKSRWQSHLRIINLFQQIVPLNIVVIEDVAAMTKKGARKWNSNFSPLQAGKQWFEQQVRSLNLDLYKFKGWDTKEHRDSRGFKKTSKKLDDKWEAHNVDSHSLVEMCFGFDIDPYRGLTKVTGLDYYRRQLRLCNTQKQGKVKPYGGTMSLGIKRGTLVNHPKWGRTIIGGSSKGRLSLHCPATNKRIARNAKIEDVSILTTLKWRTNIIPG